MKTRIIIILIVLIGYFSSCEKPGLNIKTYLEIADEEEMQVTLINPILEVHAESSTDEHVFDIDSNGTDDLRFFVSQYKFPARYSANLFVLNDSFEVLLTEVIDTIYYCDDNRFEPYHNPIYFNSKSDYNTSSDRDSIVEIKSVYHPSILDEGEYIQFVNDTLIWNGQAIFTDELWGSNNFDNPITFENPYHYYQYGFWNNLGPKYMCFRKISDDYSRYGWILLEVNWLNNIDIYEYAIME